MSLSCLCVCVRFGVPSVRRMSLSVCLLASLSVCLPVRLSVCLCAYPSVCMYYDCRRFCLDRRGYAYLEVSVSQMVDDEYCERGIPTCVCPVVSRCHTSRLKRGEEHPPFEYHSKRQNKVTTKVLIAAPRRYSCDTEIIRCIFTPLPLFISP